MLLESIVLKKKMFNIEMDTYYFSTKNSTGDVSMYELIQ